MKFCFLWTAALATMLTFGGCTRQPDSPEQIRERTANTTEALKKNAADATAAFKRDSKAIAEGIHEGWTRDHPLNLNAAGKQQLTTLPGITDATADRIIAGRPYSAPSDLVSKRVLTRRQYDAIADRVNAK